MKKLGEDLLPGVHDGKAAVVQSGSDISLLTVCETATS